VDDLSDFVVVDVGSTSMRRARWMDAHLQEMIDERVFTCTLSRSGLGTLRQRLGDGRVTEGRAVPHRYLVNFDEDLIASDHQHRHHHTDDSMSSAHSQQALPRRLFLVVEELDSLMPGFTSASDHVICRFVAFFALSLCFFLIYLQLTLDVICMYTVFSDGCYSSSL